MTFPTEPSPQEEAQPAEEALPLSEAVEAAPLNPLPEVKPQPPVRKTGLRLIAVLGVLVMLAGLGAGGYLGWRAWQTQQARAQEAQHLQNGQAALDAKNWALAEAEFDVALQTQPAAARLHILAALLGRGRARYEQGKLDEALTDFEAVLEMDDSQASAYLYRAAIALDRDDLTAAVREAEAATAHDDTLGLPYAIRALQYYRQLDYPAAAEAAEAALQRDDSLTLAYWVRGGAHAWKYELKAAAADLNAALERSPDNPEALALRVYVAVEMVNYAQAETDVKHIEKLGGETASTFWAQAIWKMQCYDFDGAQPLMDNAVQLDATRPEFYTWRGFAYWRTADMDRRKADFEHALQLWPDFGPALTGLAGWHLDRWEYDTLQQDAENIIALYPTKPSGYYLLRAFHMQQHDLEAALADIEKGIAL